MLSRAGHRPKRYDGYQNRLANRPELTAAGGRPQALEQTGGGDDAVVGVDDPKAEPPPHTEANDIAILRSPVSLVCVSPQVS
jgi:hypothetical protein